MWSRLLHVGLVALAASAVLSSEDLPQSPYVVKLTNDNYEAALAEAPHFIKFYAPWCNYCKKLAPIWEDFAESVAQRSDTKIRIAEVDCTSDTAVCSAAAVQGYPTMKIVGKDFVAKEYSGGRTVDAFNHYVTSRTNELNVKEQSDTIAKVVKSVYVATDQSYANLVAEDTLTFVKFFAPWCGHCKQIAPIWIELGEKFAGSPAVKIAEVDCTSNLEACKTAGIRGYPSLVLFKSGSQVAKYEGGRTVDAFSTFLKEHAGGHVETYEDSQHAAVAHDGLKVLTDEDFDATVAEGHAFIKFYAPWCGHCKKMAPVWAKLAHDFKDVDRLSVAKIDCTENDRACTRHGVNGYPTLLFLRDGVKIAQHSGGRDLASLTAYLNTQLGIETDDAGHDEL